MGPSQKNAHEETLEGSWVSWGSARGIVGFLRVGNWGTLRIPFGKIGETLGKIRGITIFRGSSQDL